MTDHTIPDYRDLRSDTFRRTRAYRFHNGERATLPFSNDEYEARVAGLRRIMEREGVDACVLTSMHCIAYYTGFLYCAFGRPYACVVTADACVTVSAGIDAGQPWRRSHGDNVTYTPTGAATTSSAPSPCWWGARSASASRPTI